MKRLTSILALMLIAFLGFNADPVPANDGDLIWDALAQQGTVVLKAKYKESPENGLIDQTLEVEIQDAPANTTLFISINGRPFDQMVTNAFGRGTYRRDVFGVRPDSSGRPAGPRIETGDVIRVHRGGQGISATFELRP